jgi:hypothetical protein
LAKVLAEMLGGGCLLKRRIEKRIAEKPGRYFQINKTPQAQQVIFDAGCRQDPLLVPRSSSVEEIGLFSRNRVFRGLREFLISEN